MNMLRLLLLAAAAWLIWRIWRQVRAQLQQPKQPPPEEIYRPMARCARCGTYLPADTVSKNGLCGRCGE